MFMVSHNSLNAIHAGQRSMHNTLLRNFYWHYMAVDASQIVSTCPSWARNDSKSCHRRKPWFFLASKPLNFVAWDVVESLSKTPQCNQNILFISKRYSKLTQNVSLFTVTVTYIGNIYFDHWLVSNGIRTNILTNAITQFASKCFGKMCTLLCAEHLTTTVNRSRTNGKAKNLNKTNPPLSKSVHLIFKIGIFLC